MTPTAEQLIRKLSVTLKMSREETIEALVVDFCAQQAAAQRVFGRHPVVLPCFVTRNEAQVLGRELYELLVRYHERRLESHRLRRIMDAIEAGRTLSKDDRAWFDDNKPFTGIYHGDVEVDDNGTTYVTE